MTIKFKKISIDSILKTDKSRSKFTTSFLKLTEWAQKNRAKTIFIGGSYVDTKQTPSDMDIIIIFPGEVTPNPVEIQDIEDYNDAPLDVILLLEKEEDLISSFLNLFSKTKNGVEREIYQIDIDNEFLYKDCNISPEFALHAYTRRGFTSKPLTKGLVIPIHGIRTNADWMPNFTFEMSRNGYAVAPYVFGYTSAGILLRKKERELSLEKFRTWMQQTANLYDGPISIIAHSYGSYLIARYLFEFYEASPNFNTVILCGSILNQKLNWEELIKKGKLNKVVNTVSTNDEWVGKIRNNGFPLIAPDKYYGSAGKNGFTTKHEGIVEIKLDGLKHTNIHSEDIYKIWLPHLLTSKKTSCSSY